MTIWRHIIAWLVWLSADPVTADLEHARAAAAVSVARASMVADTAPAPGPTPPAPPKPACVCGETCVGGYWRPDGRIYQKCECQCERCRKARTQLPPWGTAVPVEVCPDGRCPVPAALPTVVTPAKP
jgi:hypothetical protein